MKTRYRKNKKNLDILRLQKLALFYYHALLFVSYVSKVRKNVNVLMRPSFQSIKSRLIVKLNDPGLLRYRIFSAISFPSTKFTCYTH